MSKLVGTIEERFSYVAAQTTAMDEKICVTRVDSDRSGHPLNLIRVFDVRLEKVPIETSRLLNRLVSSDLAQL